MLRDDVKVALRVTSDVYNSEVDGLIETAKADMVRAGVDFHLVHNDQPHPIIKTLVILYCKAMFGYDNAEAERFMGSYHNLLSTVLNSPIGMSESADDGVDVSDDEVE